MSIPEGAIVAMLTPFDDRGKVNEKEVRKLVNFLISRDVNGIFPVASCGEYTHTDMGERKFLIDVVMDEANGRTDVIPGTGATCYHQSIELAQYAREKGCSAVVLHGPYFFQNTRDAVEGHLKKVAESVEIPIFLYNIPFFANEVTPSMVESLCNMKNVVGIKDSSGNMINVMNLIEMTKKVDPDFKVLVGIEEILLPALLMGGRGCMTATTGIFPEFMTGIWKSFCNGNYNLARNLQFAILPLIREMKSVNFPQGFKEAMSIRGIDMGKPMMNYPKETLARIADLRERLKIEMNSLLYEYFPGMPLTYKAGEEITKKYDYPSAQANAGEKKFDDCTLCGMCDGTAECSLNGNGTTQTANKQPGLSNLSREDIESIISETVKKIKGEN
jgi:N-acetylneuraminate lyase/4-hydroxy-tetrahydrodipicolinate synthase